MFKRNEQHKNLRAFATNNEPAAREFKYHSGRNYDLCVNAVSYVRALGTCVAGQRIICTLAFPDVKDLEELFVETDLVDLLSSLPIRSVKTEYAHLPRRYSGRLYRRPLLPLKSSD